jgi:hypothetical protein
MTGPGSRTLDQHALTAADGIEEDGGDARWSQQFAQRLNVHADLRVSGPVGDGEAGLRSKAQPDPLAGAQAPGADCHDTGTARHDGNEQDSGLNADRRPFGVKPQGYLGSQGYASCLSTVSQYRYRLSWLSAAPVSRPPWSAGSLSGRSSVPSS